MISKTNAHELFPQKHLARQRTRVLFRGPAQQGPARILLNIFGPWGPRALGGRTFTETEALWVALRAAFQSLPPTDIINLYNSMPHRMAAVMASHGGHAKTEFGDPRRSFRCVPLPALQGRGRKLMEQRGAKTYGSYCISLSISMDNFSALLLLSCS